MFDFKSVKRFVLFLGLFSGQFSFSQDVIIKINGDSISGEVKEVGLVDLLYKASGSKDNVERINLLNVRQVVYNNGHVDNFFTPEALIIKSNGDSIPAIIREFRAHEIIYKYKKPETTKGVLRRIGLYRVEKVIFNKGEKHISLDKINTDQIISNETRPINGEIVEFKKYDILIRRYEHAPVEEIPIYNVKEVIYEDGTSQAFNSIEYLDEKTGDVRYFRNGSDRVKPGDEAITSGPYADFLIGVGHFIGVDKSEGVYGYSVSDNFTEVRGVSLHFGIQAGAKFYFGKNEQYRTGLDVHLFGANAYLINGHEVFSLTPVNLGVTHARKIKNGFSFESSLVVGYAAILYNGFYLHGGAYRAGVKFQYSRLVIGGGINGIYGKKSSVGHKQDHKTISCSIGVKL